MLFSAEDRASLCTFVMVHMVRSAALQTEAVQDQLHSLLQEAGCIPLAESFSYWVKSALSCAQMAPLTPDLCSLIVEDSDGSVTPHAVLQMLQGATGSSVSSSMGAFLATEVLNNRNRSNR